MPELPDVITYVEAFNRLLKGSKIQNIVMKSPFVLRTFDPPIESAIGCTIQSFSRLGKRVLWHLDQDLIFVFHLMIAGRFHWKEKPRVLPKSKTDLIAFHFEHGSMMLTEASKKKRASIHVVEGPSQLEPFKRSGIEVLECTQEEFLAQLKAQNRTLKRALTDPNIFSGVGNAYSDEILLEAGLSPLKRTQQLNNEEAIQLFEATRKVLNFWITQFHEELSNGFPEKVTAFRPGMAAHGKYGQPCPKCQTKIQRIRYADNECNYCPRCQTGGKLLADRSLSRLLKGDWPKTIEELEG